jgi:hypothetical protein
MRKKEAFRDLDGDGIDIYCKNWVRENKPDIFNSTDFSSPIFRSNLRSL